VTVFIVNCELTRAPPGSSASLFIGHRALLRALA
jgi:hypothetical protein